MKRRSCPNGCLPMWLLLSATAATAGDVGTMTVPEKLRLADVVKERYKRRGRGAPGTPVDGLTLAATLAAPPVRGECVTLWLTLTNVSERDVYILQNFWGLHLQPVHVTGTDHARIVGATATRLGPMDFVTLKPGQSIEFLMDADPISSARGAKRVNAYLEVCTPDIGRAIMAGKPGVIFGSSGREAVSGPIEMEYAGTAEEQDAEAARSLRAYLRREEGAEDKLAGAAAATQALRRGLRLPDEESRWSVFQLLCRNPRPEMEEDVVDFLARWGPRTRDGRLLGAPSGSAAPELRDARLHEMVRSFGDKLPEERRLRFYHQVGLAIPYDYREAGTMVSRYTASDELPELACAAKVLRLFCERGDTRPEVWNFVAWQMYSNPDEDLHDAAAAERYARRAMELRPQNDGYRLVLSAIRGDQNEIEEVLESCRDPDPLNSLSWKLATLPNPSAEQVRLAVAAGERAVSLSGPGHRTYPYILDTVAAAYAAAGRHEKAVEAQEKAIEGLPQDEEQRDDYVRRLILYLAQAKVGPGERPGRFRDLGGDQLRDALIRGLRRAPEGTQLRRHLMDILRERFADDPAARKALGETPPRRPADVKEVF